MPTPPVTDPPTNPSASCPVGCELGPLSPADRADLARDIRIDAAVRARNPQSHPCNSDEIDFQADPTFKDKFPASFTKGLPHDDLGEVDAAAYCALLEALGSGDPDDFDDVDLGCPCSDAVGRQRRLENPQAALAFDLQAPDSHALTIRPPPKFTSAEEIAEIAELYWMALARDVPFSRYPSDPLVTSAATDLASYTDYFGATTAADLFRGDGIGVRPGPYVSQLLLRDVPYGSQFIPALIRTVLPGIDYMTAYPEWLAVQNGCDREQRFCDPVRRYVRNGRDLGQYVHVDNEFNAFVNAAFILQKRRDPLIRCEARAGIGVEFAQCLPYPNPEAPPEERFPVKSENQIGIATFGFEHLVSLLLEATNRALKAVWFQKWGVHRRLRPEEFAGRIHNHLTGARIYPFHAGNLALLQATVLPRILEHNRRQNANRRMPMTPPSPALPPDQGTHLLSMAYAEGSPLHPAYGAGHATVAGACGTILKAFFPSEQLVLDPVEATDDGLGLVAYRPQPDPVTGALTPLTLEAEINKLVANIALGRNFAGVHWRTDYTASVRLGEDVATGLLCEQRNTFNEAFEVRFNRYLPDLSTGSPKPVRVRIRPGTGACPVEEDGSTDPGDCNRQRRPEPFPAPSSKGTSSRPSARRT